MSDHRIHWQPGVEEIVAREVTKALREAADELDRRASGGTAFNAAARVVRALADPKEKP